MEPKRFSKLGRVFSTEASPKSTLVCLLQPAGPANPAQCLISARPRCNMRQSRGRCVVRTIATGIDVVSYASTGNNSRFFESNECKSLHLSGRCGRCGHWQPAGVGSLAAGNGRLGQWLWSITWAIVLAVGGRSVRRGSGLTFLSFLDAVEEGARPAPPVYARGGNDCAVERAWILWILLMLWLLWCHLRRRLGISPTAYRRISSQGEIGPFIWIPDGAQHRQCLAARWTSMISRRVC